MTHRLLRRAAAAAGLSLTVAAVTGAGSAAARAQHSGAPRPGVPSAVVTGKSKPVLLVTGRTMLPAGRSGRAVALSAAGGGPSGPVLGLDIGGRAYEVPGVAVPYLGRGLGLGLFDVRALAAAEAEAGGRVPVQFSYRGPVPRLPGVTITSSSAGSGRGYLTARSARDFGAALARQFAADHRRGTYGTDGIFAGGVSLNLAGAAPAPARPDFDMHTLTVTGTSLAGKPDTGDIVNVINVDNINRTPGTTAPTNFFLRGSTKFSVPTGHYCAIADYFNVRAGHITGVRVDILPQFTVSGDTTVHTSARAASSKITMVTPRPATPRWVSFWFRRMPADKTPVQSIAQWFGSTPIWVSPTTRRPTVGSLNTVTNVVLAPRKQPKTPYSFFLDYQSRGIIPAQRHVVSLSSLATTHQVLYQQVRGTGLAGVFGLFPGQEAAFFSGGLQVPLPGQLIEYVTASPVLPLQMDIIPASHSTALDSQTGPLRTYRPGEHLTEALNEYPLHPAYDINGIPNANGNRLAYFVPASASRSRDQLTFSYTPFSDSTPGDSGNGFGSVSGDKVTGSYRVDVNGVKVAGGNAVNTLGFQAKVSPKPSVIRFTLDASRSEPAVPGLLSDRSQTVWQWRSAHEAGAMLPRGWMCGKDLFGGANPHPPRDCAVQPLLTLRYTVARMSLSGSVKPGAQLLHVQVGHLPLTKTTKISSARMAVSFNGGSTWHNAEMTGTNGDYRAAFTTPKGSTARFVTLRVNAADTAGSAITETIWRAFAIAR